MKGLSSLLLILLLAVLEVAALRDEAKQRDGRPPRLVLTRLPLAHRLLPDAEPPRQLDLRQPKVVAKGPYAAPVPALSFHRLRRVYTRCSVQIKRPADLHTADGVLYFSSLGSRLLSARKGRRPYVQTGTP